MLLFFGEFRRGGSTPPQIRVPPPVDGQSWISISAGCFTIHYCDFSPRRDRTTSSENSTTAIAGHPVIQSIKSGIKEEIELIDSTLTAGKLHAVKSANGVYCGFHLNKKTKELKLFTDYLGLRKLFISESAEGIKFANTQWLIERTLPSQPQFDEQAVVEIGILGHALGNKTRRANVKLLSPGHLLTVNQNGELRLDQFHDLTATQPSDLTETEALEALHSTWIRAVKDRAEQHSPLSFLSGGMDSRLLVHSLKSIGLTPYTANFAPPLTMDRVFAELVAEQMGSPLWMHPTGDLNTDHIQETVDMWTQSVPELPQFSTHRIIWSGDGGSVGIGHVYLDDEINALCRDGNYTEAAIRFCTINKRFAVEKAYRKQNTREIFESAISELIGKYGKLNRDRAAYYFLMFNDQRRHMDKHYETIHKRLFDFALPFFDKRLIELVASLPSDLFNNHRMYDRLFRKIGGSLTASPWQTYPGHVICGLPIPDKLEYQWGANFYSAREEKY